MVQCFCFLFFLRHKSFQSPTLPRPFILRVLCSQSNISRKLYGLLISVPILMYTHGPMFPGFYILSVLCSEGPKFSGSDHYQGEIFSGYIPMSWRHFSPSALHSQGSMLPWSMLSASYVLRAPYFQGHMFPRYSILVIPCFQSSTYPGSCIPKVLCPMS